jgi:hypothetical protein
MNGRVRDALHRPFGLGDVPWSPTLPKRNRPLVRGITRLGFTDARVRVMDDEGLSFEQDFTISIL